jgi:hypothetical protein
MSETSPSPATGPRRQSAACLKTIIITFLTPMFLWSCGGDADLARVAAIETLDEFGIIGHRGLITAAKIIAYELATLSSLGLSMADDIPPALALRLRSNANSLDRAAERNRRALEHEQRAAKAPPVAVDAVAASVAETRELVRAAEARAQVTPAPAMPPHPEHARQSWPVATQAPAPVLDGPVPPTPVPPTPVPGMPPQAKPAQHSQPKDTQSLWNAAWSEAMADVAAEFTAGMARLPPAEQAREKARIDVLLEASTALASGTTPPFGNPPDPAGRPGGVGGNATGAAGFRQRPG